ncbi:uncharacterized protein AKAME5_002510600 [Lates japonicus]|uniref:Immunoglobulin domain-containing protein n=1 Tax=Lates japonicus TaxID=270547 RepID=A0AAD3NIY5_LATJO|nr:uncharacterized protein AKAME5_002510600 [Lates japonicus]
MTWSLYSTLKGRTTLNPTTGELVVQNMAVADAGLYTVEINSNVQSQNYKVEVMKKVPKPAVLFRPLTCNSCSLTCHGDTKGAGTITYSWREDDGEWNQGEESRDITNNPEIRRIRTFSCRMKNSISVNESEPHENPFFQEKPPIWPEVLPSAVLGYAIRITFYLRPGDSSLMTTSASNPITSLVWKRDGNLVAEWMNSEIKFNETYKGRTTLNTTTGELDPITDTLWKRDGNLVAEWLNDEFEFYGAFNGRTTLNTTTGELVVQNMTMCFLILSVLLLTVLNSAQPRNEIRELGSTFTLRPPFSGSITGIVWKRDGNLVAEWLSNDFEFYGTFNGRTTLNPTTGELVVQNMAVADAGLYTVEINSNVQSENYKVEVMKKVPKPAVLFRPLTCSQISVSCSLTCDGDTKDAGTVTYSWREDDGEWKQGERDKTIENNEEIKKVKIFSCQMKNAISINESEPHNNLLFQGNPPIWPEGTEQKLVYFVVGGTLVLRPYVSAHVTSILWKHEDNLVAKWINAELAYYCTFKSRTTLDPTGCLVIKNMSRADNGLYTVEINNHVQGRGYKAIEIDEVPQPVVSPLGCYCAVEKCMLACYGNTTKAEPVTYSWRTGDGAWMEWKQELNIGSNEAMQSVKTFICRIKNPVSEKESEPYINPLLQRLTDSGLGVKVLGPVMRSLAILALLGTVTYFLWQKQGIVRKVICPCRCGKGDDNAA